MFAAVRVPLSCPPELPRAVDAGEGGPVPKWVGRATVVNGRARTAAKPPVTLDGLTLPDAPSLLVDVKGVVMQANPAAVELAGAQGADDLVGHPLGELLLGNQSDLRLLRADGSRKPAYDALNALVHGEWWLPPTQLSTSPDGRVDISGWAGEYRVEWRGLSADVTVAAGTTATADLTLR